MFLENWCRRHFLGLRGEVRSPVDGKRQDGRVQRRALCPGGRRGGSSPLSKPELGEEEGRGTVCGWDTRGSSRTHRSWDQLHPLHTDSSRKARTGQVVKIIPLLSALTPPITVSWPEITYLQLCFCRTTGTSNNISGDLSGLFSRVSPRGRYILYLNVLRWY